MTDADAKVCNYLSATLELTASVVPELATLVLVPCFDQGLMEFSVEEDAADGEKVVSLNVRQIECLVDFLTAWLARRASLA